MNTPTKRPQPQGTLTEQQIIQRRDEAVRRALNTPPKPYKDAKVGKAKPKKPSPPSGKRGGA